MSEDIKNNENEEVQIMTFLDEEGKKRYESALRHVAIAKENGKSVDELHAIFKKVMEGTGKCSGRRQ